MKICKQCGYVTKLITKGLCARCYNRGLHQKLSYERRIQISKRVQAYHNERPNLVTMWSRKWKIATGLLKDKIWPSACEFCDDWFYPARSNQKYCWKHQGKVNKRAKSYAKSR